MTTSRKFATSPDILVANATVLVAISSPVKVSFRVASEEIYI